MMKTTKKQKFKILLYFRCLYYNYNRLLFSFLYILSRLLFPFVSFFVFSFLYTHVHSQLIKDRNGRDKYAQWMFSCSVFCLCRSQMYCKMQLLFILGSTKFESLQHPVKTPPVVVLQLKIFMFNINSVNNSQVSRNVTNIQQTYTNHFQQLSIYVNVESGIWLQA